LIFIGLGLKGAKNALKVLLVIFIVFKDLIYRFIFTAFKFGCNFFMLIKIFFIFEGLKIE